MAKVTPPGPNTNDTQARWRRARYWLLGPPREFQFQQNEQRRYDTCSKCARAVGPVGAVTCALLMIMKGYLGIVGNSRALVADAVHSGADLLSALMLIVGLRIARRPADSRFPYGYGKVEYLVAVLIYSVLIIAGIVIFADAIIIIIRNDYATPCMTTFAAAMIAILVNELLFRHSLCAGVQMKSPSIIANAWEKRSDALTSIAVLIGIGGAKLGLYFLDPLAAIFVGCFIMKFSVNMLADSFKGLMDKALSSETVDLIRRLANEVPGVQNVETIRTRETGQSVWIDMEIIVAGETSMAEMTRIKTAVKDVVLKKVTRRSTVNVYVKCAT